MARAPFSSHARDNLLREDIQRRGGRALAAACLAQDAVDLLTALIEYSQTGRVSSYLESALNRVRLVTRTERDIRNAGLQVEATIIDSLGNNRCLTFDLSQELLLPRPMSDDAVVEFVCRRAQDILQDALSRLVRGTRPPARESMEVAGNPFFDEEIEIPVRLSPGRAVITDRQGREVASISSPERGEWMRFHMEDNTTAIQAAAAIPHYTLTTEQCKTAEIRWLRLLAQVRRLDEVVPGDPVALYDPIPVWVATLIESDATTPRGVVRPSGRWLRWAQDNPVRVEQCYAEELADFVVWLGANLAAQPAYAQNRQLLAGRVGARADLARALLTMLHPINVAIDRLTTAMFFSNSRSSVMSIQLPSLFNDPDVTDIVQRFLRDHFPGSGVSIENDASRLATAAGLCTYLRGDARTVLALREWVLALPLSTEARLCSPDIADAFADGQTVPLLIDSFNRWHVSTRPAEPATRPALRVGNYRDPAPRPEAPRSRRRVVIRGKLSSTPNE